MYTGVGNVLCTCIYTVMYSSISKGLLMSVRMLIVNMLPVPYRGVAALIKRIVDWNVKRLV